jgi:arylsulfatase A-like enzyme
MTRAIAASMLSLLMLPYLGYAGREPAARVRRRVAPSATAPNVVVFMSDDLSLATLNAGLANGWMPNLQTHIVNQGTTFANSFVADSVCCPSRATFLTGQQSHNHGVTNNQYPGGGVTLLDARRRSRPGSGPLAIAPVSWAST